MKHLKHINEDVDSYDMKDAYSFDRLEYMQADAALELLKEFGFNDEEQEEIFRSKHMRWFCDEYSPKIKDSTKKFFREYCLRNFPEKITAKKYNL